MWRLRAGVLIAACLAVLPAAAQQPQPGAAPPRIAVRSGQHPGFLRLAFTWPRPPGHSLSVEGETVTLRFDQPGLLALGSLRQRLPRGIVTLAVLPDGVALRLRPGTTARVAQFGPVVALDLVDASPPQRPAAAAAGQPAPRARPAAPLVAASPAPPTALAGSAAAAAADIPSSMPIPPVKPPPVEARRLRLPFPPGTGAAMLERGGSLILIFDAARDPNLPAIRALSSGLAESTAEQRRSATVIRLPLAPADAAASRLVLEDGVWTLALGEPDVVPRTEPVSEALPGNPPRLLLRVEAPGQVVPLPDPEGDGLLQLGTVLTSLPGMPDLRSNAAFALLPTRLGLAVLPRAQEVALKVQPEGFTIQLPSAAPQDDMPAPATEVLLDLPNLPLPQLLRRRQEALAAAAATAAPARGLPRLALAEALLALGLAPEAQGLIQAAMEEDPRLEIQAKAQLLLGVAALLSGRLQEAATALRNPRLDRVPEALLWRGLLAGGAAADTAAQWGTLQRYPDPLRDRAVPLAVEVLVTAGRLEEAAALLRMPGLARSARLAFADASLLEARKQTDAALAAYGLLAGGRDRDMRARALQRSAELRLATARDDPRRAAAAMEAAALAWRGDDRELALRQRAAALHVEAGEAAAALALLRETEPLFPEAAESLQVAIGAALPLALADPALPAPAAAKLVEQWAETAPQIGATLLAGLAERLQLLDLQPQAADVLRRALGQPLAQAQRATLGLRLTQALYASDDFDAAAAALRDVPAAALPGPERGVRARLEADLLRRTGDAAGLHALGPDGATQLAELLAAREDWAGAAQAIAGLTAAIPPAPARLDAAQRQLLIRQAAFMGLAGDEAGLAALRTAYAPRFDGGPLAGAFTSVTADIGVAGGKPSLQQLRQDIAGARALQDQLRELR